MIQANEIRLGNYFNVPREDQSPFRVDLLEHFTRDFVKVGMNVFKYETHFGLIDGHPLTWELADLQPIFLTKEIILNGGFVNVKKLGVNGDIFEFENYIQSDLNSNSIWIGNNNFKLSEVPIHRLQNIFFALIGEELEIKL